MRFKWLKNLNGCKFLSSTKNVSIFITGSNSWLLSGELATLLSGRYVSFRVMPFRFQEMCEMLGVKKEEASEKEFMDYITWGVMPQRFYFKTEEETKVFMTDLYDSIVLKDIVNVTRDEAGITTMSIYDFLLKENSLEL